MEKSNGKFKKKEHFLNIFLKKSKSYKLDKVQVKQFKNFLSKPYK